MELGLWNEIFWKSYKKGPNFILEAEGSRRVRTPSVQSFFLFPERLVSLNLKTIELN